MKSKKVAVTLIAGLLLVLLYGTIFSFSAQDGETSGNISMGVSDSLVKALDFLTGGRMQTDELTDLAVKLEHPIRKTAHFLEYALMGILVYTMLYYPVSGNKRRFWISVLWVIFSAAADELHQLFVPDRAGRIADVILDTCGGITGIWFCSGLYKRFIGKN
ncbi:MAG: VanZ family protein [Lachnospiraceae bacterium]|nr:VanZ family protein [Lachnospiraceae bacterium]